ncbi:MAG TPA: TRAM domain-containing protein [Nitrososphaerales archaeon]|nr:TRAM domain-containing protein [Nitrososphaerales archaeon]
MSDRRRSQRGSFYGDKRPEGYEPRHRRGRGGGDQQYAEKRGGGAAGEASSGAKPVEIGKEYKVRVIDRSERGEGVARVEGFIVFIKGAKPGEELTIRITNVGSRAATAEVVQQPQAQPASATTTSSASASSAPAEAQT